MNAASDVPLASEWEYVICLTNISTESAKQLKLEVEQFERATALSLRSWIREPSIKEPEQELGVRLSLYCDNQQSADFILDLVKRSGPPRLKAEVIMSIKAREDSEYHDLPVFVTDLLVGLKARLAFNYTFFGEHR